jgi:hypothetical protein
VVSSSFIGRQACAPVCDLPVFPLMGALLIYFAVGSSVPASRAMPAANEHNALASPAPNAMKTPDRPATDER